MNTDDKVYNLFELDRGFELDLVLHKCINCGNEQITDDNTVQINGCCYCEDDNTLISKPFTARVV
jgi:hypothetical protein